MEPTEPVRGEPMELVDRFMELIGQDPDGSGEWIFNNGALAGVNIGVSADPAEHPRDIYITYFRSRLEHLVTDDEVDEAFLISALLRELDEFWERQADSGFHAEQRDEFITFIEQCIADADRRGSYRRALEAQGRTYGTDEEFIAELQRTARDHPLARPSTAEKETRRWALTEQWRTQRDRWFPDDVVETWRRRRTARSIRNL